MSAGGGCADLLLLVVCSWVIGRSEVSMAEEVGTHTVGEHMMEKMCSPDCRRENRRSSSNCVRESVNLRMVWVQSWVMWA